MNLTDNEILKFQRGGPIFLEDICAVYSVALGAIVDIGYDNFQQYLSILTATKPTDIKDNPEMKEILEQLTDFQYILLLISIDTQVQEIMEKAFNFFTHSKMQVDLENSTIILQRNNKQYVLSHNICFLEIY